MLSLILATFASNVISTAPVDGFRRFIDYEAGVVCYVYDNKPDSYAGKAGIACLLITETKLAPVPR